jgi:exonuclease III
MKILYWNIRGVANSPSRLALKRLVSNNNPDFVFIAEPWMNFSDLPRGWLARMGLKMFCLNDRGQRQSNLWCLCKDNVNPNIISVNDQQVSFSYSDNNKSFYLAAIYASTDYAKRRDLLNCLSNLQQQFRHPWCFIGDFNTILGAHEHKGNIIPARVPIEDFQNWTNSNNLLHLSTSGALFTWSNGRGGSRHTERRLDRTICNQDWVDACNSMNCSTLVRNKSDHYPLLFDCITHDLKFKASFKFMKMWSLHEGCQGVIADSWKERVIGCPMFILSTKLKRLKERIICWNKDIFGNVHSYVN